MRNDSGWAEGGGGCGAGAGGAAPGCETAHPAMAVASTTPIGRTVAQGSIGTFRQSISGIDWHGITSALSGVPPPVTACPYCGRANDPGAQFCIDCGKPMARASDRKPAATPAEGMGGGGGGGGGGGASGTSAARREGG